MAKKYLGSLGEKIALKYYQQRGFILLAKNFLTRSGELDLVLFKDNTYYGVEVKTRTNYSYGFAEEMINKNKILKMKKASYYFSAQANWQLEIIIIYLQNKQAKIKRFALDDYWLIVQNAIEYVCEASLDDRLAYFFPLNCNFYAFLMKIARAKLHYKTNKKSCGE